MRKLSRKETNFFAAWENGGFIIAQTADDRFVISKDGTFIKMVNSFEEARRFTDGFPKRGVKLINGHTYEARGGGSFLCRYGGETGFPTLQNVASGYTFKAAMITMFPDGKIEWGASSGGRFEKVGGNIGQSSRRK